MRINKFICNNTNISRREADRLISEGKVTINGKIAELGSEIKENDKVKIGARFIKKRSEFSVIVYNKKKGELVSNKDDRGRATIFDNLPRGFGKWRAVGRLDYASEGLILLTDSAAVAGFLAGSDLEREYYVKVKGSLTESLLNAVFTAMREGLTLKDARAGGHEKSKITEMSFAPFLAFSHLGTSGEFSRFRVIISEGQNRELRRFFAHFNLEVVDLKRVAFGRVSLDTLSPGKWRYFSKSEYEDLRDFLKQNGLRY